MKLSGKSVCAICVGFSLPVMLAELLQGNLGFIAVLILALGVFALILDDSGQRERVEP